MSTTGTASVPYGAGELMIPDRRQQAVRRRMLAPVGAANLDLEDSQLYVSFDRRVVLDGVVLDAGDIALCQINWYTTGCASVQKYFDASDAGWATVDAFDQHAGGSVGRHPTLNQRRQQ